MNLEQLEQNPDLKNRVVDQVISLVLEKKYGIPGKLLIFQEDIMALCSYGAGFTLGEADSIRRAMGKKKKDLMVSFKEKFINGWNENVGMFGEEVWDKMEDYSKYCFNKSHAVAYTLISLKTAELESYYFNDFMRWNYENLKQDMKNRAAEQMLQKYGEQKYPTYRRPYEGIKFGGIEFKNIPLEQETNEIPEQIGTNDPTIEQAETNSTITEQTEMYGTNSPAISEQTETDGYVIPEQAETNSSVEEHEEIQQEYEFISDLFMCTDVKNKVKFITRGLYDNWTQDTLGLIELKKKLGKKADVGFGDIPSTNDFGQFLKYLKMKKMIVDYVRDEENHLYTIKTKKDEFKIYDKIENMPMPNRNYRVKNLIKEFGVAKLTDFSPLDMENLQKYMDRFCEILDNILDRWRANNPNLTLTRNSFQKCLDNVSQTGRPLYLIILKIIKCLGSYDQITEYVHFPDSKIQKMLKTPPRKFTVGVNNINIMKNGRAKIELQFQNCKKIFYTKNQWIKTNVKKKDIIDIYLNFITYLGKDGKTKILMQIADVEQL